MEKPEGKRPLGRCGCRWDCDDDDNNGNNNNNNNTNAFVEKQEMLL